MSFAEIPDEQKGDLSAWETPHPDYWVSQGYVVVRVDERGVGSSPGFLDTMSASTSSDFAECVEWAADQDWSTGKIGLLGISYYGGTQWRVAARKPKGLTCIIPWEGMTDHYRDRVRQGGIFSNQFVQFWFNNQVGPMQYGNAEKTIRRWGPKAPTGGPVGPDCIEGTIPREQLLELRRDQTIDNREQCFLDEPYHSSRVYNLGDIEVPYSPKLGQDENVLMHMTIPRERAWMPSHAEIAEKDRTSLLLVSGSLGVLRASHREIDSSKSIHPNWPWHPHTSEQKLERDEIVKLEIGIWAMGWQYDAGESLRAEISGGHAMNHEIRHFSGPSKLPGDETLNHGRHVIHFGGEYPSKVILPFVKIA